MSSSGSSLPIVTAIQVPHENTPITSQPRGNLLLAHAAAITGHHPALHGHTIQKAKKKRLFTKECKEILLFFIDVCSKANDVWFWVRSRRSTEVHNFSDAKNPLPDTVDLVED